MIIERIYVIIYIKVTKNINKILTKDVIINVIKEEIFMVKSTGIIRKVDELGRIVIPMELRTKLGIAEKDALEIFVDGNSIILKKCNSSCIFCGNSKNLISIDDKLICSKCKEKIINLN